MLKFDGLCSLVMISPIHMGVGIAGEILNNLTFLLQSSWSTSGFALKAFF
jgi:hypothetical protein